MARKPATSKGTKIGSAARMPATTMTNAATVSSNRPAGDWEENGCIGFYGLSGFLMKDTLIYRPICPLPLSMILVFSFSVLEEGVGIEFIATDKAEEIEQKHGLEAAQAFHDEATTLTPTLSEAADEWLTSIEIMESTRLKRRKAYEGLHEFLGGDILPHKLTDVQARDYVDLLKRSDLSPNTIRDKLSALGGLWQYMFERLIIPKGANPWKGFTIKGGSTESCRAFTNKEILTLLDTNFPQLWHKDVFICLLLTGARPKEICGLRNEDVELKLKRVFISSSKTKAGIRELPVEHPVLLSILKKYKKNQESSDFIFPVTCGGADKSPAANYTKMFGRVKKALGFPPEVQLYSARKSFMTTALDLELPLAEIERYVGHTVGRLIYTVYSQGRGEKGLREVAKGFKYGESVEEKLISCTK